VSVIAWRIIQRKFAKLAFRAEGARLFGGRWNSPGHPVVYTAQSLALAALEILVHVDSDKLLQDYLAIPATVGPQPINSSRQIRTAKQLARLPSFQGNQNDR
jgi:RES domain-containing protein